MKKLSPAFNLEPMSEPITLVQNPKNKKWYPLTHFYSDKSELFIYGEGYVKIGKWKRETVEPCGNPFTSKELKTVCDTYGLNASMGMVKGWGHCSLYDDHSYGLDSAKMEVANMATLGEAYDKYSDHVQQVGDAWIEALLKNGFSFHNGDAHKGWLYYDYKNSTEYGKLLGQCGVYEKIRLHPLQHVDHSLGVSVFRCRCLPMFNPMSFDDMLGHLFRAIYIKPDNDYSKVDSMLAKIVSVKDRIAHLTNKAIAEGINSIFEAQKELDSAYKS